MENKNDKSRFYRIAGWVVSAVFTVLLLTPLVLLAAVGQDDVEMEQEKQYTCPSFSLSDFVSGDFQDNFEQWFSTKYPHRSDFVKAYRQLRYDVSDIGFDVSTLFIPKQNDNEADAAETDIESETSVDTLENTESTETEAEAEKTTPYSSFNPLYAEINKRLYERTPIESSGYRGTDQVIIGKSGYCYENGYINEMYGYTKKYATCSDEWLEDRAEKLEYIQKRLNEMGIAFTLIFTPSKGSAYSEYIPDWYKAQNTSPEGYVRPVERLRPLLDEKGINYIYSADLFKDVGLDETFPITGIHWNKLAAVEATNALLENYEEQSGTTVRKLNITGIREQSEPSGFGNPENDIFSGVYSGVSTEDAIVDEYYYVPEVETADEDADRIKVLIHGGSFCWDFKYYFEEYKIVSRLKQFYYNTWQGAEKDDPFKSGEQRWSQILNNVDYVIFECNEQLVCQVGCNAPQWAAADRARADTKSNDVYTSLYNYLKSTESADNAE